MAAPEGATGESSTQTLSDQVTGMNIGECSRGPRYVRQ